MARSCACMCTAGRLHDSRSPSSWQQCMHGHFLSTVITGTSVQLAGTVATKCTRVFNRSTYTKAYQARRPHQGRCWDCCRHRMQPTEHAAGVLATAAACSHKHNMKKHKASQDATLAESRTMLLSCVFASIYHCCRHAWLFGRAALQRKKCGVVWQQCRDVHSAHRSRCGRRSRSRCSSACCTSHSKEN